METLELGERSGAGDRQGYLESSATPLTGFLFALPLFIVYHVGLWWLNTFAGLRWANAVDIAIANVLGRLGIVGPALSFILVVIVFLLMHAMSGKSWSRPSAIVWFLMVLESLALALPVFLLSRLVEKVRDYLSLSALLSVDGSDGGLSWQANLILSCGAGVYEEFFFRVLMMGGLVLLLDKVFGVKSGWKFILAGFIQAVVFSASHHLPGGPEEVTTFSAAKSMAPVFAFRTAAGIYFAFLYVERGFGIAAGAHAGYDLMVVLLEMFMPTEGIT